MRPARAEVAAGGSFLHPGQGCPRRPGMVQRQALCKWRRGRTRSGHDSPFSSKGGGRAARGSSPLSMTSGSCGWGVGRFPLEGLWRLLPLAISLRERRPIWVQGLTPGPDRGFGETSAGFVGLGANSAQRATLGPQGPVASGSASSFQACHAAPRVNGDRPHKTPIPGGRPGERVQPA